MAANKVRGIRAALCNDLYTARMSREHNDANVLAMGGRIVAPGLADEIVALWLNTALRRGPPSASRRPDHGDRNRMATPTDTPSRWRTLATTDPDIARVLRDERHRQNTRPRADRVGELRLAGGAGGAGSVLTNKYAEGYPGKRYYGGCEFVDVAESLAIARAKELFGAEHANVQPHSGAQANMAVYFTLLKPGDTVLGMNLAHGGHLTHGHPLNFSGKLYTIVPYGVRKDDERIDYEELERLAHEHKPKMIMVGASAYPRVIDFERIGKVGPRPRRRRSSPTWRTSPAWSRRRSIRARCRTPTSSRPRRTRRCAGRAAGSCCAARSTRRTSIARLFPGIQGGPLMHVIAAKAVCLKEALEPNFVEYQKQIVANARRLATALSAAGFRLVSGGTDNHLMLVDVFSKGLTGKVAEAALGKAGITVNKNAIPFDQNPPMVASGIRIGTPAITSRGMREPEMDTIGELIARALASPDDDRALGAVRGRSRSPVPEVPAVSGGLKAHARWLGLALKVASALAPGGPIARALPGFEARPGQLADGRRRGRRVRRRAACSSPRREPARARRSPTSSRRSSAASACSSPPARRTSRSRSTSRTSRCSPQSLGVKFTATYMKGRGELPLPAPVRGVPRQPGLPHARRHAPRQPDRGVAEADRHRRPGRGRGPSRGPAASGTRSPPARRTASAPTARTSTSATSRACASAPPSQIVVIVNHHLLCADAAVRQGSYGEVIPRCDRAIVDEAHQLEDIATQYFGISVSNYRVEDLARDVERAISSRQIPTGDLADELRDDVDRLRDRARRVLQRHAVPAASACTGGVGGESRVRVRPDGPEQRRPTKAWG